MPVLKRNAGFFTLVMAAGDACVAAAAYLAAAAVHAGPPFALPDIEALRPLTPYGVVFVVAWLLAAAEQRLFVSRRDDTLPAVIRSLVNAALLAAVSTALIVAFFQRGQFNFEFMLEFALIASGGLVCWRILLRLFLRKIRRRGMNFRRILIIGANERARHFAEVLLEHEEFGYRLVGVLDDDESRMHVFGDLGLPYLGKTGDLQEVLTSQVVDEVYITLTIASHYDTIHNIASLCESVGVIVRLVADFFPVKIARRRIDLIEDVPLLSLSAIPEQQLQLAIKRLIDVVASGLGLLILLPTVFLPLAIMIKLDSRGPVFFGQERVGMNMRRFKMLKFRSMVANAEELKAKLMEQNEAEGPVFKMRRDPRITRIGSFIRKYSIDELPQLINVFLGHMSLVGPRPPLPSEVAEYEWSQRRRLSIRPGITGLWQVTGRSDTQFDEWVQLDLDYIDHWSLDLDFKILLRTFGAVVKGRGAA